MLLTVSLALAGALIYGVADFLGGFASRRTPAVIVAAMAAAAGILPLLIGLAIFGGSFSADAVIWGLVAGVSGSIGVLLLYAALAVGPMSVLSPVTALVAAVLPTLVAVLRGAALTPLAIASLLAAMVAVVLLAATGDGSSARVTARGLVVAVIAGCGFGGLVLAYERAPADGMGTLLVARILQTVLMTVAALVTIAVLRRRASRSATPLALFRFATPNAPAREAFRERVRFAAIIAICGVCDAGANIFIQAALNASDEPTTLPIVGVLNGLYPLGTILLAAIVLRERLGRLQVAGVVLVIAAGIGMAVG